MRFQPVAPAKINPLLIQLQQISRAATKAGNEQIQGAFAPDPSIANAFAKYGQADPNQMPLHMGTSAQSTEAQHSGHGDHPPPGATDAEYIRYANQNAIRNKPLNSNLVQSLSYLKDLGITAEVFSGGQDAKGHGDRRTGSVRHDHGNAADVYFYQGDRRLDYNNPQDLPIFQKIVELGVANGLTGFGAGDGYMRPGSMHIGFGNPGVWGAGGKGTNAAQWLNNTYTRAISQFG